MNNSKTGSFLLAAGFPLAIYGGLISEMKLLIAALAVGTVGYWLCSRT